MKQLCKTQRLNNGRDHYNVFPSVNSPYLKTTKQNKLVIKQEEISNVIFTNTSLKNIAPKNTLKWPRLSCRKIKWNRLLSFLLNRNEWHLFVHPGCPHESALVLYILSHVLVELIKITVVLKFLFCCRILYVCILMVKHIFKKNLKNIRIWIGK